LTASRLNAYAHYKFHVTWDGRHVAGFSEASGLDPTPGVTEFREGADVGMSRTTLGATNFEAITLARGVTHDVEFERWATSVGDPGNESDDELASKRRDLRIELHDEAGQIELAFKVFRTWVSDFAALPDLDASANAVAIEHLTLENEGWERDTDLVEPTGPSSHDP
jgi:phage tail-like protein